MGVSGDADDWGFAASKRDVDRAAGEAFKEAFSGLAGSEVPSSDDWSRSDAVDAFKRIFAVRD